MMLRKETLSWLLGWTKVRLTTARKIFLPRNPFANSQRLWGGTQKCEKSGRAPEFPTNETVEVVLDEIKENSSISVRMASRSTRISQSAVHCILQVEGYHQYHRRKIPAYYEKKVLFFQETLQRNQESDDFSDNILWTNESLLKVLAFSPCIIIIPGQKGILTWYFLQIFSLVWISDPGYWTVSSLGRSNYLKG